VNGRENLFADKFRAISQVCYNCSLPGGWEAKALAVRFGLPRPLSRWRLATIPRIGNTVPMQKPAYTDLAPIAAPATGSGPAALSIIRTSGQGSIELLAQAFSRPRALLGAVGNTVVYGWIMHGGESRYRTDRDSGFAKDTDSESQPSARLGTRIDEVLVNVYRSPKSYTGEDGADIICHGGSAAPKAVFDVLLRAGFREALRGEFTFRAFTNGKLSLSQAESVLEMVEARTDKARGNAVSRLSGALGAEIDVIKQNLVIALAALELSLDYSELDGIEDAPEGLPERDLVNDALARLAVLADAYRSQRLCNEGALVVIAGKPNAGKSSLFNLLLKEERAIVTPIPGTTRDYIEATLDIGGIPVRLVDTAGLREADGEIEAEGIRRSRALAEEADLVILVKDSGDMALAETSPVCGDSQPAARMKPTITVWNKIDIAQNRRPVPRTVDRAAAVPLSAKTGAGLPELLQAVSAALLGETQSEHRTAIGTDRQRLLVGRAITALKEAVSLADTASLDLAAPALKDAIDALGEISGEVTNDAILATMFSRFCVGK
jgi:tRNA modification GTPase